jgi:hypothetical protein
MSAPSQVMATGPQPFEITITFSIAGGAPAGTIVPGSISAFGPLVAAATTVVVPITEVWHIVDIYKQGGPAVVDAFILVLINGYVQNVQVKLSSINLNLLTRFRLGQSIVLSPASTFAVSLQLLATAPAGGGTETITFQTIKSPFRG